MRFPLFPLVLILLSISSSTALAEKYQEKCPCGPDSIKGAFRLLLMQGHRGADFRDACRKHDLCYDTPGSPQKGCDDVFLAELLATCDQSKAPRIARFKAKLAYWLVSNLGGNAYRSAQEIAFEKSARSGK